MNLRTHNRSSFRTRPPECERSFEALSSNTSGRETVSPSHERNICPAPHRTRASSRAEHVSPWRVPWRVPLSGAGFAPSLRPSPSAHNYFPALSSGDLNRFFRVRRSEILSCLTRVYVAPHALLPLKERTCPDRSREVEPSDGV